MSVQGPDPRCALVRDPARFPVDSICAQQYTYVVCEFHWDDRVYSLVRSVILDRPFRLIDGEPLPLRVPKRTG